MPKRQKSKPNGTPISDWVARYASHIRPGGLVLDLACGKGRHSHFLAGRDYEVLAVDRNAEHLAPLAALPNISTQCTDLETGDWTQGSSRFDGIVVINYLHRPLFPHIIAALNPGGTLIYDTFAVGNEQFGKPSNPDFLLTSDELLRECNQLEVVAYEHGQFDQPVPSVRQRICATKSIKSMT